MPKANVCQRLHVSFLTQLFFPKNSCNLDQTHPKPQPPSETFYILQVYGPFFYGFCVFTCCKRLPGELGDEENDENCVTNRERGWLTQNFHLLGGRVLPWGWGDEPSPPVSLMEKVLTFWNLGEKKYDEHIWEGKKVPECKEKMCECWRGVFSWAVRKRDEGSDLNYVMDDDVLHAIK